MNGKLKKIARGATDALKLLWGKGFFKEWRDYPKTVEYLGQEDYHFTPSELGMALKRAKYLTRRGKRGNYEYIQKYPFIQEDEE